MFDELMMMIASCGEDDVDFWGDDGDYTITFRDFIGFDDDWSEMFRRYTDEAAIDALLDWLASHCVRCVDDFYMVYYFDGFTVEVGYTSFDI